MRAAVIQRGAIVAGALLASAAVLQAGIAQRVSLADPALAARIAPGNARIAVTAANSAITRGADVADPDVQGLVVAALKRDTTVTAAIELRAVTLGVKGEPRREAQLFGLSSTISRRSLPTRLWLIQRSVERGDVAGALHDFDVALRTSAAAPPILFPVLADATSDVTLIGPIAQMLDQPSDWRLMFLNFALAHGDARSIGETVVRMRDHAFVKANGLDRVLIARLVELRSFAFAGRVRDAFSEGTRSPLIADGGFADPSAGYPFGWQLTDRGDVGAERAFAGGQTVLSYRAEPGRGGQVAAQLLLLAPGRYRLATRTASASDTRPYWTLTCGEQRSAALIRLDLPTQDRATSEANLTIPSGCAGQWLTLTLQPGGAAGGQTGTVASVSISRL
ncbi:hypothetical protein [Sphingomonas sp.]|jgi:hypothetical protein|uniref:hypothetical protein n=1 Tax=Sphingomonas sp. TaxID=28214 RepID=UPI002E326FC7|nr:hypothetical protein [Sphingomonas sp.]HEX4695438.1 hypothetical protein [Sphingomonas sp.]